MTHNEKIAELKEAIREYYAARMQVVVDARDKDTQIQKRDSLISFLNTLREKSDPVFSIDPEEIALHAKEVVRTILDTVPNNTTQDINDIAPEKSDPVFSIEYEKLTKWSVLILRFKAHIDPHNIYSAAKDLKKLLSDFEKRNGYEVPVICQAVQQGIELVIQESPREILSEYQLGSTDYRMVKTDGGHSFKVQMSNNRGQSWRDIAADRLSEDVLLTLVSKLPTSQA